MKLSTVWKRRILKISGFTAGLVVTGGAAVYYWMLRMASESGQERYDCFLLASVFFCVAVGFLQGLLNYLHNLNILKNIKNIGFIKRLRGME